MIHPNFTILYVDSPEASSRFYADLLGIYPVETSPSFALFALNSGLMLGLWSRHTVEPAAAEGQTGAFELAFPLRSYEEVDRTFSLWSTRGIDIRLPPKTLEFGRSFVATDPDGHRLRVFAPDEQEATDA